MNVINFKDIVFDKIAKIFQVQLLFLFFFFLKKERVLLQSSLIAFA